MANILLYGAPGGSPFVRKVQIALAEKALSYELVPTLPITVPPPGVPLAVITPELKDRSDFRIWLAMSLSYWVAPRSLD